MNYSFSVIIPSRGQLQPLKKSLDGILNSTNSKDFELIIINDGASEAINAYLTKLRKAGFNIYEITNTKRVGAYGARNQGIREAKGEWLLFIDDDLTIPDDWFQKMQPFLANYHFICCNIQMEEIPGETLGNAYSRINGFQAKAKFKQTHFGLTTFLMVHQRVFKAVGLFDSNIFAGGDFIFSRKVYENGFQQVFLENLVIWHRPKSWKQQFYTMCRINKGKIQRAHRYPELCGKENLRGLDLLRTIKYLFESLIWYKRTNFYQEGEVNWLNHQIAQFTFYTLYLCSQILVLTFPRKDFNW